jgi:predicted nucleic acid-binding protein
MKVVWDADVVLDVLLAREPQVIGAARLMAMVERGELGGYLCDTTVLVLYAVARRLVGEERADRELRKLLLLFDVAAVNRVVLESALVNKALQFQHAVLYESARHLGAEAVVTRSFPAFRGAQLPVATPEKLLKMLSQRGRRHAEAWR